MTNFPGSLDTDASIPAISNNITELGGEVINDLRSAMFAVEANLGIGAAGTTGSVSQRLAVSINADGTIIPAALYGIGLIALPIVDDMISATAAIEESKLALTYSTNSLYNLYLALSNSVDVLNGWLSLTGIKLEPHIDGIAYNHELSAIFVDAALPMLKTSPNPLIPTGGSSVVNRNTTNADYLINDISNDLLIHEKSDGSASITPTNGGTVPPTNYGHVAGGIWLETSTFTQIPQTTTNLQSLAEYIDTESLLLEGARAQTFFANGITRTARSANVSIDGYGAPLVPATPVLAYLLGVPPGPISSTPVDSAVVSPFGDDVILFQPTASQLNTFNFDAQFAQVSAGDLLTINYGVNGVAVQYVIDSIKSIINGTNRIYAVRINGKNLFQAQTDMAHSRK